MYLLGWTIDQWAQAIGTKGLDEASIKGAVRLRCKWLEQYGCAPGVTKFIGIEPEMDYDTAYKLLDYPYWLAA